MPVDYRKTSPAAPPAGVPAAPAGGVVTLTKASPAVSLAKQAGALRVNLNWNARPAAPKRGFLAKLAAAATTLDLDLGALWELTDGTKGVVQALGGQFGSLTAPPYLALDGDDRSGARGGGENLEIALAHAASLRRVLVFASVYSGAAGFGEAGGVVTLTPATGPDVVVDLGEEGGRSRMCAVALVEFERGVATVRREVRFVDGAQDALDEAYGWGLRWRAGRK